MEYTEVKNLGIIGTGNTPSMKNSAFYDSPDIPFFKPSDISGKDIAKLHKSEYFISHNAREKARVFPKGTVLCTCIGIIGKIGIVQQESACNQQINYIIPNANFVPEFIAYSLKSQSQKMIDVGRDAPIVPIINKTKFEKIKIPICSLKEQKKIVAELDNIEEGIRVKETQLKALDELIQSRFTEMFEHIKTKDKISNLCLVNPAKPKNIDDNLLVSFLPMANVSEQGNADLSVIRKYQEVKKGFTYFQDDDILFAKITPCMENGKGALVKNLKNNIGFGSTEFHVIRVQKALIPQYLFTITQSKSFRSLAKANMTGSVGQQRVPASFIENFSIPVPPFPLQNKFAQFVQQVEKAKEIVKIQIKDLQELLALKMDEYFK